MKARYFLSGLFVLLALLVASCQGGVALPGRTSATPQPEETTRACSGQEAVSGLPIETQEGFFKGWQRYYHSTYGFAFYLPADWELVEGENYLCLRPQIQPETGLIIGVRDEGEEAELPSPDFEPGSARTSMGIWFFNRFIFRHLYREGNLDKGALYMTGEGEREITAEWLVFSIFLEGPRGDDSVELSMDIQNQADLILQSFSFTR